ncbi:MAG TPA: lipoprotein-releasing ABC transporter permease subunit [archaeon]|nr:lipoprotein-releasing ABC transporter permease subunit [archaeon]
MSAMRVELFIGWRYLFSRRNSKFLSFFTLISICGVFVGVMALIVILAVLNGFHNDLKEKILGTMPQITLFTFNGEPIEGYDSVIKKIESLPGILSVAPLIYSECMLVSESQDNAGAILRGVDPVLEERITDIKKHVFSGAFSFKDETPGGEMRYPGIVLGSYLAQLLRVGLGDIVTIWAPKGVKITPFGLSAPWRKFRVTGLFETGLYDVDAKFVYLSLEEAQSFFGMKNAISHIEVRLVEIERAREVREEILDAIGGYPFTGTDWITYNKNLFEALKLEKAVMFVILTLIILVAAFNIVSTLTMLIMDKTREIGILRSMGLTSRAVGWIFISNGLVIGALGTVLGAAAGYVISLLLNKYQLISIPGDVYFISSFPVNMQVEDFILVTVASMLISFVATIYPALRAASLPPVDAIRYE